MTPVVPTPEPIKVAVRCDDCKRIVAYKIAKGSGRLQLKCPKCGCEVQIDLSLRRAKHPIYYRTATVPLAIPMR